MRTALCMCVFKTFQTCSLIQKYIDHRIYIVTIWKSLYLTCSSIALMQNWILYFFFLPKFTAPTRFNVSVMRELVNFIYCFERE